MAVNCVITNVPEELVKTITDIAKECDGEVCVTISKIPKVKNEYTFETKTEINRDVLKKLLGE